jgi:hypothetical protein
VHFRDDGPHLQLRRGLIEGTNRSERGVRGAVAPAADVTPIATNRLSPEVLEPVRGQLGVAHRVLDIFVAEPRLQRPCDRQLARDFHFMARCLPHGQNRSTLLKMAEECERLADVGHESLPQDSGQLIIAAIVMGLRPRRRETSRIYCRLF